MATALWTARDEAELKVSRADLAKIELRRAAAIEALEVVLAASDIRFDDIDYVLARADEIRDALAPFDSGVRVGIA